MLPGGILNNDIEFFVDPEETERVYAIWNNKQYAFIDFPDYIIQIVSRSMDANPDRVANVRALGYRTDAEIMEKYIGCTSGAFDGEPDVVDGEMLLNEFWLCPNRSFCPASGKICNGLRVGDNPELTNQEIAILTLTGNGHTVKETAGLLNISPHTVSQHHRHIRQKTGLQHMPELVKLAYHKNLVK